ncbi:MAG TPA: hypothetical protein VJB05_03090 [archaeon]|nr:hypothetical protein [archaeon]
MPVVNLHKDVSPREYCPKLFVTLKNWPRVSAFAEYACGVLQAMDDRRQLINEFFSKSRCSDLPHGYGWRDFDPHVEDVGVEGRQVGIIETHHDRSDLTVYTDHPKADALVKTAKEHGYEQVSL